MSVTDPQPNWKLARALYLQGVKNSIIADQCHLSQVALRQRVSREKWTHDRDNLKAALSQANQTAIGITLPSVTQIGQNVRQILAGGLQKAALAVDGARAPKSLKAAKELAETCKAIGDPGKTVFAWEDQKPTVVLDLGSLRSVQRATPVIDVTQVPAASIQAQTTEPKQDSEPNAS